MHSSEDMAVWRLYGSRMHTVVDSGQLSALNKTIGVPTAMCVTRRDVSLKLPIKLDDFSSASCPVHEFLPCSSSFGQFHHLDTDAQKLRNTLLLLSC